MPAPFDAPLPAGVDPTPAALPAAPLPVYVLSLPRHADRRRVMDAELARLGLAAEIVEGVDGATLTEADWACYDGRRCRAIYGLDLLPGEMGCALGHRRVLERIRADGPALALVLEDDVRLDAALVPILTALAAAGPGPWDLVRLAGLREAKLAIAVAHSRPICPLGPRHALYRLKTHILGAQGYVVTQAGAQRLLDYTARIFLPWDHAMDRYWENGLDPYVVHPFPIGHRTDLPSAIGTRDPGRRHHQGAWALWRRRFNRWRDGLAKRWYRLRHL